MRKEHSFNLTATLSALVAVLMFGPSSAFAQTPPPDPPEATVVEDTVSVGGSIDPILLSSVNTPVEAAVALEGQADLVDGVAVELHETDVLAAEVDGLISSAESQSMLQYMAIGGAVHAFKETVTGQGWIILSYVDAQGDANNDYLGVNAASLEEWWDGFKDWWEGLNGGGSNGVW